MFITRINDDELLPLQEQVNLFEKKCSTSPQRNNESLRQQLARLHKRLNSDLNHSRISVLEYVDLSLKLSQQKATLTATH